MRPIISHHGGELLLLGVIAVGVLVLCALAIERNAAAEASAWTAILMAIINAVKERWSQRSIDMATTRLHASRPMPQQAGLEGIGEVDDPQ